MLWRKFIERQRWTDRISGEIHISLRFEQDEVFTAELTLGDKAFFPGLPGRRSDLRGEHIDDIKADIVPRPVVLASGISQSCYESHQPAPSNRLLLTSRFLLSLLLKLPALRCSNHADCVVIFSSRLHAFW